MKFTPMNEEELREARQPLPAGEYDAEIVYATETATREGLPQIALEVKIWNKNGVHYIVKDWLSTKIPYKLKHICDALNMIHEYEQGEISPSLLLNQSIRVKTYLKKYEGNEYPKISDYKPAVHAEDRRSQDYQPLEEQPLDEQLPF